VESHCRLLKPPPSIAEATTVKRSLMKLLSSFGNHHRSRLAS
jgi:hypothetical protein